MQMNIYFRVNKGETIAFIGSTGSGKSTLINLVPRFYDATDGEVLVDGINVKDYKQSALNNKLGYVPQKAFMFTATVPISPYSVCHTELYICSFDNTTPAFVIRYDSSSNSFVDSVTGSSFFFTS